LTKEKQKNKYKKCKGRETSDQVNLAAFYKNKPATKTFLP
jgi:hypothetical protein